jgi:hypothetical protein
MNTENFLGQVNRCASYLKLSLIWVQKGNIWHAQNGTVFKESLYKKAVYKDMSAEK